MDVQTSAERVRVPAYITADTRRERAVVVITTLAVGWFALCGGFLVAYCEHHAMDYAAETSSVLQHGPSEGEK